jgi:hypothetical protein
MEYYVYKSEEEEIYNSKYHCHFNKKLAEWAISNMRKENPTTGMLEPVKKKTLEEYDEFLQTNKLKLPDESYYDGYYLMHMCEADYKKSLEDDKHRALFIEETICDPDCEPIAVLACFKAKMDIMGIPIYWERFF